MNASTINAQQPSEFLFSGWLVIDIGTVVFARKKHATEALLNFKDSSIKYCYDGRAVHVRKLLQHHSIEQAVNVVECDVD
ncbi:hypothetical protein F2P81_000491 [Scophthalmus maximus]|uniref:Uncharacterized protein n=1 Tax=Scophthalmus maximus TaxID=52904 RepID=A0A6A4TR59_SCOMX|nr:hypothetical protein F2P81_000491 [Scophthalmus maximus]